MKKRLSFLLFSIILLSVSCSDTKGRYKKIDLSDVPEVNIDIHRYEVALFSIEPDHFSNGIEEIAEEFKIFLGDNYKTPQSIFQLIDFMDNPIHQDAWFACQEKYKDIEWLRKELADGFHRYRYFYPATNDITLYTYISGYNWENSIHILEDTIVVGLDNYLGANFEVYQNLQIPQYIAELMDKDYIVVDIFKEYIESYAQYDQQKVLIDYMIAAGKTYYFLDILLPRVSKEHKIGYTPVQMQFCQNNEDLIWQFFIEQNILFSSDYKNIRAFILNAPFTNGFSFESPGRIGQWIGWQIVVSYMNKNKDITLQELMVETDYSKILQNSGYKPKR
ncbi:MAG: hypothetical protein LBH92_02575 [Bacteroidales bacterium]|nr:hypothetical protein [Bacteroidales bacterium]